MQVSVSIQNTSIVTKIITSAQYWYQCDPIQQYLCAVMPVLSLKLDAKQLTD